MKNRKLNIAEFLSSLDVTDELAFCKKWSRFSLAFESDPINDEFLRAAFAALDHWSSFSDEEPSLKRGVATWGAISVISKAVSERPNLKRDLVEQLARYCLSPNLDVAAGITYFAANSEQFSEWTMPYLRKLASSDSNRPPNKTISLRGLAFKAMYQLSPDVAGRAEFHDAQRECAQAFFIWSTQREEELAEELVWHANLLIWC
jgi:hypothetical protein